MPATVAAADDDNMFVQVMDNASPTKEVEELPALSAEEMKVVGDILMEINGLESD